MPLDGTALCSWVGGYEWGTVMLCGLDNHGLPEKEDIESIGVKEVLTMSLSLVVRGEVGTVGRLGSHRKQTWNVAMRR